MIAVEEPIVGTASAMDRTQFGLRVRALRMAAGLSQKALAEAAGVPQSQVSRWEAGESVPLATTVPQIAAALGVEPNDLFEESAEIPAKPKRGRPPKADDD